MSLDEAYLDVTEFCAARGVTGEEVSGLAVGSTDYACAYRLQRFVLPNEWPKSANQLCDRQPIWSHRQMPFSRADIHAGVRNPDSQTVV